MRKARRAAAAMGACVALALGALAAGVALAPESARAAPKNVPPYWASIAGHSALMRTGPGTNFPATWRYVRTGMPLRVVQIHKDWRRVRDPEGTEGWMRSTLLSARRTAMVQGDARPLYAAPGGGGAVVARVEAGVVGGVARCADGWCRFQTQGRSGYVEERWLWGVDPDESLD